MEPWEGSTSAQASGSRLVVLKGEPCMLLRRSALIACALTLWVACLSAQTVSSSILGTVLDPADAVVPSAAVTLTDHDTGATRTTATDGSGLFRFLNVTPSTYSVAISVKGFKSFVQSNI